MEFKGIEYTGSGELNLKYANQAVKPVSLEFHLVDDDFSLWYLKLEVDPFEPLDYFSTMQNESHTQLSKQDRSKSNDVNTLFIFPKESSYALLFGTHLRHKYYYEEMKRSDEEFRNYMHSLSVSHDK